MEKNEILKRVKAAIKKIDKFNLHFFACDSSDMHEFKIGNYALNFGYSYSAYSQGENNGDNEYPEDFIVKVSNIEVYDVELYLYKNQIIFSDDDYEDLKNLIYEKIKP